MNLRRELALAAIIVAIALMVGVRAPVFLGADNLRDAFNPLGRADPLETASLLAAAAHLPPDQALAAVSADAWTAMGRPAPALRAGSPAAFVAVAAADANDLLLCCRPAGGDLGRRAGGRRR